MRINEINCGSVFKASAIKQGRFLKVVLDGLFSFNTVISQPVQLLYHVAKRFVNERACTRARKQSVRSLYKTRIIKLV